MRKFLLLFCVSLAFHIAGTWILPLIDRDEPRFAEASREMLARGDYVIPYFNNRFRFDKPPLTYWLQTLSYRAFGENDFAARFPSAVAASSIALLLLAWGKRIGPERLGWWAAIIFTICLQTFVHAKAAVADMWLVFFMTAAHWAGFELLRDRLTSAETRPKAKWWWIFYGSLAFAFLAKGPIGWAPLLTILCARFFLANPDLNRRFLFFTGIPLMLAIVAIWGVPALTRSDGEFLAVGLGKHVLERSLVAMEGHGSDSWLGYVAALPFYFVLIFVTFFPWSFRLPWLVKRLWRERDPVDNYLAVGSAIIFAIFTIVKTKLPHYTLPAFPLLALLMAKMCLQSSGSERFVRRAAVVGVSLGLAAVLASPIAAKFFPSYQLLRQARGDLTPEMEFGGVRYREPSLVWYARRSVKGWFEEVDDRFVPEYMQRPGARFVVLPTTMAAELYPATPPEWKRYSTQGFSTANLKWVDVTLLLKPH